MVLKGAKVNKQANCNKQVYKKFRKHPLVPVTYFRSTPRIFYRDQINFHKFNITFFGNNAHNL